MAQIILACDDNGKFLEYIPKELGHRGEGRRHLAITVLIYNSKGQVILQKRKHKVFDNIWDIGATHPFHKDEKDESLEEAALRCAKDEYGIKNISFKNLGAFNYFAKYGELCENEHCFLMIGEYDGEIRLNPKVGYEYKWMDKDDFLLDLQKNSRKYSPWAIKTLTLLKNL